MPKLNKLRAKERFVESIEGVDKEEVFSTLKENTSNLDLYTFFVTYGACNTGFVDERELYELVHKLYADWYFLTKHNTTNIEKISVLQKYSMSPNAISYKECMELIKSGEYNGILPIKVQYLNKLEDKYFVSIDCDKLYNRKDDDVDFKARLYINLPANKILEFVKEFTDRVYFEEVPVNIKFLNDDSRCDNIILYCDYETIEKIVEIVEDIHNDYPSKFKGVGKVNPLLAKVNDYIGFGEYPEDNSTYFVSRTEALSSIRNIASVEVLKNALVEKEKKIIFRSDGKNYTPSEYLLFLIEKNAIYLIENKINKLENNNEDNKKELSRLYKLRQNIEKELDVEKEVNALKKSLTRNERYSLKIDGVEEDNFDYINRLYSVFSSEEERHLKKATEENKKAIISSQVFRNTQTFMEVDTLEFLQEYFRYELAKALEIIINDKLDDIKYTRQSSILNNLKKKECLKLKAILKSILNNDDEGRIYIDRCIKDYTRILSTGELDGVEIYIENNKIDVAENINSDILFSFTELQEKVDNMSLDYKFIDKILQHFDINPENVCLNLNTKNSSRIRRKTATTTSERHFYYDPGERYY